MASLFPESDIFKSKKGHVAKLLSDVEKARGIVNGTAEAVIKFDRASVGIKTQKHMTKAATYIARNGKVLVENEKGDILTIDEVKDTVKDWCDAQDVPFDEVCLAEQKNRPADARRMIISCPKGSDPHKLKEAARQFGQEFFLNKDYEYIFAVHYKSEEMPKEPDHPHVHFLIKSISSKDKRLNPKKVDLRLMRERFAVIAKEHGIDLNATSRAVRGQTIKSKKQEQIHQERRGAKHAYDYERDNELIEALKNNSTLKEHKALIKAKITRKAVLNNANEFILQLKATGDKDDLNLANKLERRYKEIALSPVESKQQLKLTIAKRIAHENKKKSGNIIEQSQAQKWAIERKKKQLQAKQHER